MSTYTNIFINFLKDIQTQQYNNGKRKPAKNQIHITCEHVTYVDGYMTHIQAHTYTETLKEHAVA